MSLESRNARALGFDLPAGADTPDAPWRQTDPEPCETCGGEGYIEEDGTLCRMCEGHGVEETPVERLERIAIEKADADHDAARDEPQEERL